MNKLKMALLAALALPTLNVVAEEKAEEAKSDFSISYTPSVFSGRRPGSNTSPSAWWG